MVILLLAFELPFTYYFSTFKVSFCKKAGKKFDVMKADLK